MVRRVCKTARGRCLKGSLKGHSKQLSLVVSIEILWTLHSGCSVAALQDDKRITTEKQQQQHDHTHKKTIRGKIHLY